MSLHDFAAQATVELEGGYRTWQEYQMMSVNLEDAWFLYSLVRTMRPKLVVELGTGQGVSGKFIAGALAENGDGLLVTFEQNLQVLVDARRLLKGLPVKIREGIYNGTPENPDLIYIDSESLIRAGEIERWLTNGGDQLVVVHDANRNYPELQHGNGVFIPGADGFWVGKCG